MRSSGAHHDPPELPLRVRLNALANPFPFVLSVTALLVFLMAILTQIDSLPLGHIFDSPTYDSHFVGTQLLVFACYCLFFISWWAVYFSSKWIRRVRTLRTLLLETSTLWGHSEHITARDRHAELVRKAQTTIPVMALLATTSVVVLSGNIFLLWPGKDSRTGVPLLEHWQLFLLHGAAVCGLAAFICFFIAADALDTMANVFASDAEFLDLPQYFLSHSRSRYYPGLSLLILELGLLTAVFSPMLGALLLATALGIGSSYWYGSPQRPAEMAFWGYIIGVGALMPIVMQKLMQYDIVAIHGIGYAWVAGGFWALSSEALRAAGSRMTEGRKATQSLDGLLLGLTVGALVVLIPTILTGHGIGVLNAPPLVLVVAGCLSMPIGAMFYLMSVSGHDKRPEVPAMLITRIKPLLVTSAVLMTPLYFQPPTLGLLKAVGVVFIAVAVMAIGTKKSIWQMSVWNVPAAMGAALSWAGGEVLIGAYARSGSSSSHTSVDICQVVVSAWCGIVVIWSVVRLPRVIRRMRANRHSKLAVPLNRSAGYFLLHGLLSFGIAYPLLFEAIKETDVVSASVASGFWPGLAMLFGWEIARRRGEVYRAGSGAWLTSALLLAASVLASR